MSERRVLCAAAPCLGAALLCAGQAGVRGEGARDDQLDLLDLLPRAAEVWVEVPDIDSLSAELARTPLARLVALLGESVAAEDLALELPLGSDLPERLLERSPRDARGWLSWLAEELGLPAEPAAQVAGTLSGSLAVALLAHGEGATPGRGALVLAAGLAEGASTTLVDVLGSQLGQPGRARPALEWLELERGARDSRALARWRLPEPFGAGYLVVRPGLALLCLDGELAGALHRAEARARDVTSSRLAQRRSESRARGEFLFARLEGGRLNPLVSRPEVESALRALGLGELRSAELGLASADGRLTSRLRLGRWPPAPPARPVRDTLPAPSWSSLEVLPADCPIVLGLRASPCRLGQALSSLLEGWGHERAASLLDRVAAAPLFAGFAEPGALVEESLVFLRTAGPGVPVVYLATPASPRLDETFLGLAARGHAEIRLGSALRLVRKRIASQDAWVVFDEPPPGRSSVFALTSCAGTWVLSDVSAHLQSLLRRRGRERLAEREAQLDALRRALWANISRSGQRPERMCAFLHVQGKRLADWLGPYARLGLQLSGAVEDPDDLLDGLELAEVLGDTTIVAYELEDSIEVHGSGLLGGLALIF